MIERAAVEGKVFHEGAVAQLAPEALRPSVGTHLAALVRKELIRPEQAELIGRARLPLPPPADPRRRVRLDPEGQRGPSCTSCSAAGSRSERGERTPGYEEIIGYHLEQAFRYRAELGPVDDATRALAREAAERLGIGRPPGVHPRRRRTPAVNLISRAVALLPPDDPSRVDLVPERPGRPGAERRPELGRPGAHGGGRGGSDRRTIGAWRHTRSCSAASCACSRSRTSTPRGALRGRRARDRRVRGVRRRARARARLAARAQAHYLARRAGPCAEARSARSSMRVARVTGSSCGRSSSGSASRSCSARLRRRKRLPAARPARGRRRRRRSSSRPSSRCSPTSWRCKDEWSRQTSCSCRWRQRCDELGESIWLFAINFGFVRLLDDPVAAERELRPGYEALRRIGEKSHFSSVAGLLSRALCAQGRYDEAEQLSRESEEAARPNDIHSHILWRTTRAQVLAHRGELESAEALAREAVAFAAASDFLDSHGDALMSLAEVLRQAARPQEAAAALEEAARNCTSRRATSSRPRGSAPARGDRPKADVVDTPPRAGPAMALPRSCHTIAAARALAVASVSSVIVSGSITTP